MFQAIANSFGELLSLDLMTVSWRRLSYARFCVGVSQGVDLPKAISLKSKLGTWDQCIEYESIPFICFHYKKVGHWAKKCPPLKGTPKKVKKVWVRKAHNSISKNIKGGEVALGENSSPQE